MSKLILYITLSAAGLYAHAGAQLLNINEDDLAAPAAPPTTPKPPRRPSAGRLMATPPAGGTTFAAAPPKATTAAPPKSAAAPDAAKPTDKAPPAPVMRPACATRTADVKKLLKVACPNDLFDLRWIEDHPIKGLGKGEFRIQDSQGDTLVEMITSFGSSVGKAPAQFCLEDMPDHPTVKVGLLKSSLNFGWGVDGDYERAMRSQRDSERLQLRLDCSFENKKVHITDLTLGNIQSTFSPSPIDSAK